MKLWNLTNNLRMVEGHAIPPYEGLDVPDDLALRYANAPGLSLSEGSFSLSQVPTGARDLVLWVINGMGACGGNRAIYEFANRLLAREHQVALYSIAGVQSVVWFPLRAPIIARLGPYLGRVRAAIATEWHTAPFVAALPVPQKHYFVQMRESYFNLDSPPTYQDVENTYRLPLQPFTVSRWLRRFLKEEYNHPRVPVLAVGIDHDTFYPDPVWRGKSFRALIEGHENNPAKNVRDAHAALHDLPLEVWGFSQDARLARRYRYDSFFHLPDQETIRRLYSACDVLVKTTRYEGRNSSVLEAMACGCAVVATECLGTDDLRHERNCLLVPYGDVAAIRAAVQRLMEEPDLKARLVAGGLAHTRGLSWDTGARQLERILWAT